MRPEDYRQLKEQLIKHEGLRLKPYRDTVGKLTIGVGRNLEDIGITRDEAMQLLDNDISRVVAAMSDYSWYKHIGASRQDVVLSMVFNLGLGGFLQFKKLIAALVDQNYTKAAEEMLDSKWAKQVGVRADELAKQMRTGVRV